MADLKLKGKIVLDTVINDKGSTQQFGKNVAKHISKETAKSPANKANKENNEGIKNGIRKLNESFNKIPDTFKSFGDVLKNLTKPEVWRDIAAIMANKFAEGLKIKMSDIGKFIRSPLTHVSGMLGNFKVKALRGGLDTILNDINKGESRKKAWGKFGKYDAIFKGASFLKNNVDKFRHSKMANEAYEHAHRIGRLFLRKKNPASSMLKGADAAGVGADATEGAAGAAGAAGLSLGPVGLVVAGATAVVAGFAVVTAATLAVGSALKSFISSLIGDFGIAAGLKSILNVRKMIYQLQNQKHLAMSYFGLSKAIMDLKQNIIVLLTPLIKLAATILTDLIKALDWVIKMLIKLTNAIGYLVEKIFHINSSMFDTLKIAVEFIYSMFYRVGRGILDIFGGVFKDILAIVENFLFKGNPFYTPKKVDNTKKGWDQATSQFTVNKMEEIIQELKKANEQRRKHHKDTTKEVKAFNQAAINYFGVSLGQVKTNAVPMTPQQKWNAKFEAANAARLKKGLIKGSMESVNMQHSNTWSGH